MKKILGKIIHGLANFIEMIFNALINLMDILVVTFESIRSLLFIVLMFGCSAFFFLPVFLTILPKRAWYFIFLVIIIPILGPKFISVLRYANYVFTESLRDRAESLITGKKVGFENLSDYSKKYKLEEERQKRAEYEAYRKAQEEQMNQYYEEVFRNFTGNFSDFSSNAGNFNQGSYGNYQGYGVNDLGFKEKYEKSVKTLGLSVNTDIYQVKLNYRKLAKKYHPDLNKDPNAKELFQEVNAAYEFLTEENIKKYKKNYL